MTDPSSKVKRLRARSIPVSSLTRDVIDDAFALFEQSYADADRDRFERDLREKQRVILLRERRSGALKGFSTVLIQRQASPCGATVIFSGDTVIHRDYWGQKQLQAAFAKILLAEKLRAPARPLYWFLISKGYRTYMLLANAFPRAVPRCDRPDDPALRQLLEELARARFGDAFDAPAGIVRANGHERVRDGVAPITRRHLANPHVCFFVAKNPRHGEGDELACLADVRLVDIARIAVRLAAARLRARASAQSRAGETPASVPQAAEGGA